MLNVKLNVSITLIVRQKLWNFLIASPDPYSSQPSIKKNSKLWTPKNTYVQNDSSAYNGRQLLFNCNKRCHILYKLAEPTHVLYSKIFLYRCGCSNKITLNVTQLYYSFCLALIWTFLELMNCCISFSMAIIKLTLHSYKHKQWYFYQAVFIFRPDKKINWPRPRKSYSTTNYAI